MRHCRHIINTIDVPNDPLAAQQPGATHTMHAWLYMEFAENGTLRDMMDKALDTNGGMPWPNRVLWRFFMCCTFSQISVAIELDFMLSNKRCQ
jgi:hypothetical protein